MRLGLFDFVLTGLQMSSWSPRLIWNPQPLIVATDQWHVCCKRPGYVLAVTQLECKVLAKADVSSFDCLVAMVNCTSMLLPLGGFHIDSKTILLPHLNSVLTTQNTSSVSSRSAFHV